MREVAVQETKGQVIEMAQEITPLQLLNNALERGMDTDALTKLMDLQERHEANQAKRAYVEAMNAFNANKPKITKNKEVRYNQTSFAHASLDHIIDTITPVLAENGLSFNWITKQKGTETIVECVVTHVGGHSESTSSSAQADKSGGKNNIQAMGSTMTYLQRYTLCSILGLAASEDTDGNVPVETVSDEQVAQLHDVFESKGFKQQRKASFFTWLKSTYGAIGLGDIPASAFSDVMDVLERSK